MKRLITWIVLVMFPLLCSASFKMKPMQPLTDNQWYTVDVINLSSKDGQRHYRIFFAIPRQAPATRGYPVLYTTDGNAQLPLLMQLYTPNMGPAPLIVSIGYPVDTEYSLSDRTRDYTPKADGDDFKNGGGAECFYQFIEHQVKPLVEQRYSVNKQQQTLSGHSFGGLFALYILFNHPTAYQHYVAASPSIWWGDGIVVPNRTPLIEEPIGSVTITVGEYEESLAKNTNKHQVKKHNNKLVNRKQVTRARQLAKMLKQQDVNVNFIMFPKKNHGSVIPDALHTALITAINANK